MPSAVIARAILPLAVVATLVGGAATSPVATAGRHAAVPASRSQAPAAGDLLGSPRSIGPRHAAPRRAAPKHLRTRTARLRAAVRDRLAAIRRGTIGGRPALDASAATRESARRILRAAPDRRAVLADQAADAHIQEVTAHSERGGRYLLMSDLHWGLGKRGKSWSPGEDFRQDETFVAFVRAAAADPRPTTFVMNGDWLELIRHADVDATRPELTRLIDRLLDGHRAEVGALADAIANKGARLIYVRGNHDVQLVDPQIREALVAGFARVGKLDAAGTARLRQRMAWSGPAAVLGARGEGIVLHGDMQDSINNWRSPINPYDGKRRLESNLGWQIVSTLLRPADLAEGAMHEVEKFKAVMRYVRRTAGTRGALGLLLRALFPLPRDTAGERLAARFDDRVATRAWVARTGAARRAAGDRTLTQSEVAAAEMAYTRAFEAVVAGAPEAVTDRLRARSWGLNVARAFGGFFGSLLGGRRYDGALLEDLGRMPGIRRAWWGHNHREGSMSREVDGVGTIQHTNTGTWTKTPHGWLLDVVVVETDDGGAITSGDLHRAQADGTLARPEDAVATRPVPSMATRGSRPPPPTSRPPPT